MPALRIRTPFAAAFTIFCLATAYLGLTENRLPQYGHSDKGLHFVVFFIVTLLFYWIIDTSRRRVIHLTLLVCTAGLSVGSEIVQGAIPNDREFDPFDILANVLGSTAALLLCSWYHKRMIERKRASKHYDIVPGDELGDLELGEGITAQQETGTIDDVDKNETIPTKQTVSEELDNWDENAEDDWGENADEESTSKQ